MVVKSTSYRQIYDTVNKKISFECITNSGNKSSFFPPLPRKKKRDKFLKFMYGSVYRIVRVIGWFTQKISRGEGKNEWFEEKDIHLSFFQTLISIRRIILCNILNCQSMYYKNL